MARQSKVTFEGVEAAYSRLLAQGVNPSVAKIQAEVGGSMGTVMEMLRKVREQQQPVSDGDLEAIPEHVFKSWENACLQTWKAALAHSEPELDAMKARLVQLSERAEAERNELEEALSKADAEFSALEAKHDASVIEVQRLSASASELQKTLDRREVEIDGLKAQVGLHASAAATAGRRVEQAEGEVSSLRAELEATKKQLVEAQASAMQANHSLQAVTDRLERLSVDHENLEAEFEAQKVEIAHWQEKANGAQLDLVKAQGELKSSGDLLEQVKLAAADAAQRQQEAISQQAKIEAELRGQIAALSTELAAARAERDAAQEASSEWRAGLQDLKGEIDLMRKQRGQPKG